MANNRMWLVCPVVDVNTHPEPARFLLAKAVLPWSARVDNDELDNFLRKHNDCGYSADSPTPLGSTIHFKLEYEHTS